MAKKVIKNPKDLPDWFKKKNYKIPNSCISWAEELNARLFISLYIKSKDKNKSEDNLNFFLHNETSKFNAKDLFEYVDVESPINELTIFDTIALSTFIWKPSYDRIKDELHEALKTAERLYDEEPSSPLSELIMRVFMEDMTGQSVMDAIEDESDFEIFNTPALDIYNKSHFLLNEAAFLNGVPITIDLGFDDKTILDELKKWLKDKRKSMDEVSKRPFSEKDFNNWKKYKVLEVFDLYIWSEFYDIKITEPALAKALWSDYDIDADDVSSPIDTLRKTTKKKINELVNPLTVRKIQAQAALELNELYKDE